MKKFILCNTQEYSSIIKRHGQMNNVTKQLQTNVANCKQCHNQSVQK